MKAFHYEDVEAKDAGEGTAKLKVRWLITKEIDANNFAMRLFEMEPGGHSPLHSHAWEHELFILEGEGVAVGGNEERKVEAGDAVFVPPDERHQFRNDSKKMLRFLCLIPYTEK